MIIPIIQSLISFSLGYIFGEAIYNYIKGNPYPRDRTVAGLICLYQLLWLAPFILSYFN